MHVQVVLYDNMSAHSIDLIIGNIDIAFSEMRDSNKRKKQEAIEAAGEKGGKIANSAIFRRVY